MLLAGLTVGDWVGIASGIVGIVGTVLAVWALLLAQEHRKALEESNQENKRLHEKNQELQQRYDEVDKERHDHLVKEVKEHGHLRPVFCPPMKRYDERLFVGRGKLLSEILSSFMFEDVQIIVLLGPPGYGKSKLALHFTKLFEEKSVTPFHSDGLLWATLGNDPEHVRILIDWLKAILAGADSITPESLPSVTMKDQEKLVQDISNRLGGRYPLVVLDDVWVPTDVRPFVEAAYGCPILVTTTDKDVARQIKTDYGGKVCYMPTLEENEAIELVEQLARSNGRAVLSRESIERLMKYVDLDPFSIVQLGAWINDKLSSGEDPEHNKRDLTELMLSSLHDMARRPLGQLAHEGDPCSGVDLYRQRLGDTLPEPLLTLGLLRPHPARFTVEEIVEIANHVSASVNIDTPVHIGDLQERIAEFTKILDDLTKKSFLERYDPESDKDIDEHRVLNSSSRPLSYYSLHRLAALAVRSMIDNDHLEAFNKKASEYWERIVDPNHPETRFPKGLNSYQAAFHKESWTWLRAAKNLIYHLNQLNDRSYARIVFDKVYFELFWWWGYFYKFDFLEELIDEWTITSSERLSSNDSSERDKSWLSSIKSFHQEYKPAHPGGFLQRPNWVNKGWGTISEALLDILSADGLNLDNPVVELDDHSKWHVRALIDIFLAQSYRYRALNPQRTLQYYEEARDLFHKCSELAVREEISDDGAWNIPWIDYEEADWALAQMDNDAAIIAAAKAVQDILREKGSSPNIPCKSRSDIDDWEVLALSCIIWGDTSFNTGNPRSSFTAYEYALVLSYAWQFLPQSDSYTQAFYGSIILHVLDKLNQLREMKVPRDELQAIIKQLLVKRSIFGGESEERTIDLDPLIKSGKTLHDTLLTEVFGCQLDPDPSYVHHEPTEELFAHLDQTIQWLWNKSEYILSSATPSLDSFIEQ